MTIDSQERPLAQEELDAFEAEAATRCRELMLEHEQKWRARGEVFSWIDPQPTWTPAASWYFWQQPGFPPDPAHPCRRVLRFSLIGGGQIRLTEWWSNYTELIDQGYLAPFTAYGPKIAPDLGGVRVTAGDYQINQLADVMSDGIVVKSAVSEYRRLCPGAPAIVFCVDISHSQQVAKAFRDDGWRAAHVDGNTQREERRDIIASLADGRLDVLTNCGLISEGLDVPGVVAAILLRPTMSRALYLQQVGRALRPGKPKAFILDHAGCIQRHGLPDAPHEWTLEGGPKKGAGAGASQPHTRQCEHCGAFNPPTAMHCDECGTALIKPKARDDIAVELTEIAPINEPWFATAPFDEVIKWAGRDRERLKEVARARGYKPGWVYYRMLEPQDQQTSG